MRPLSRPNTPNVFPWPTVGQMLALKRTRPFNVGRRLRVLGALLHARRHGQPLDDLSQTCPNAVELFRQCPNLFRAVVDGYVDSRIGTAERVRIIEHEVRHMLRFLKAAGVDSLSANEHVTLWQEPSTGWRVDLALNTSTPHEGLWTLTLKAPCGSTVYTLSVACFPDAVLIGAIQGPKGANAMDLVRAATKALHGIRPHFFLIEVVRALCRKSGTERLLGTDCRFRLKPSGFWKRQRGVRFDYRGFWVDIGGHLSEGQQWLIPLTGVCKPVEQVESKKRAMYRRRYELLDCLERDIRLVVSVSEQPHSVALGHEVCKQSSSAVRPTWATQIALDPGAA